MPLIDLAFWQIALVFSPAILNTWGIWHVFKHTYPTQTERALWLVCCVFVPLFGGLVYLLLGRRRVTGKAGPLFALPTSTAPVPSASLTPDPLAADAVAADLVCADAENALDATSSALSGTTLSGPSVVSTCVFSDTASLVALGAEQGDAAASQRLVKSARSESAALSKRNRDEL